MGDKIPLRVIKIKNEIYIRNEDIVKYIYELAGSEETDVRERLNTAANNIQKLSF